MGVTLRYHPTSNRVCVHHQVKRHRLTQQDNLRWWLVKHQGGYSQFDHQHVQDATEGTPEQQLDDRRMEGRMTSTSLTSLQFAKSLSIGR